MNNNTYWTDRRELLTRAAIAEAEVAELRARIGQVANMAEIQSQDGNWNYSDYMCGLANGLLLAHATMTGGAYKPFSRPAQWIEEAKRTPPTEAPAP